MNLLLKIVKWPYFRFKRLTKRGKIITLIILAFLVFLRFRAYQNSGFDVSLAQAYKGKIVESVSASGEVSATNSATLAFQTAGEVQEVNFGEGDSVKKGDIIAKLDTTLLYSAYQQADATLRAAQAALNNTYDTLQGKETTESFTEISTRTSAETTKDKAYWAFASASKNLQGAIIRAPFDGVVTTIPINIVPGTWVSLPTTSTFQVVAPETTYFVAEVNENDVYRLKNGANAQIQIDAYPEEIFEGKLESINFASITTSTGGTAYEIHVSLPENNNMKFRLGMNGDTDIILSEKNDVLLVPLTAIVEEEDKSFVWISDGSKAKKIEVETGLSSIDEVEITSGLSEGQEVITRPPANIKEGLKLKIK